ncbi:OmpA family protein [Cetobacterium somerae]|uniref:OmpA family protein n=1 Tax=Cetobacterium sp. NK01 TaxID=2993530 RepID=UPI0021164FFD|nr:OmpA family protein [Cetobacterium sp. NK01]MCQ8213377.1 OmpA family protein [Cetobacterium sp. NK01]
MKKRIKFNDNNQFFLSISDLIMGVLLIFVLLYVKEHLRSDPERLKRLEVENRELKIENKFLKLKVEELTQKLKEYEEIIKRLKLELEKSKNQIRILERKEATIEELHQRINQKLLESFKDDKDIKIDTINQELILDDSVLFGINEWQLKEIGKEKLQKILPKFFSTFVDDETVVNFLEQLTIEGHTDDLGSKDPQRNYLYNLDLSQKRAYEVARFIYSDPYLIETLGEERLKKLKIYLSSNGKSNANLVYQDSNKKIVDRNKSRRVTIKYRLDIQKMLKNSSGDI